MTTNNQRRHSHFQRGSGVFDCAVCGRRTRISTQGVDHLCPECYDLAGEENSLSDYGETYAGNASVVASFKQCVERGGSKERLLKQFTDLAAHVGWEG